MKKRIRIVIGVVVIGVVAAVIWFTFFSKPFLYAGTVEADEVDISPGVSSKIESLEVAEGDKVKAGQVLARLSCEDIRILAGQAAKDYQRAVKLFQAGSMPQAAYDRAKFQHDDAALKLSWCEITAPLDGTVLATYRQRGEWVRPGVNLMTLADLKSLYAVVYVPEPMLARLSPGMTVKGTLAEEPGKDFPGKVAHIREEAEFTPTNVQTRQERERLVYGVKIHFDNPEGILKPGMTVECQLP
jgi:HlyD family secretion protein